MRGRQGSRKQERVQEGKIFTLSKILNMSMSLNAILGYYVTVKICHHHFLWQYVTPMPKCKQVV